MTVFIPHDNGKYDLTNAVRYGERVVLFTRDTFPDTVDDELPKIMAVIGQKLVSRYDPMTDRLCLTGSPLYQVACAYALGWTRRPLRLLRYDRLERAYYPISLPHIGE